MSNKYHQEQNAKYLEQLTALQKKLPLFTRAFFADLLNGGGREYSELTVLNYARDLELFFYYLTTQNPDVCSTKDITPEYLDKLTPLDLSDYMVYLSSYERDGKIHKNSGSGKNRKISSLKKFWTWHVGYHILENDPTKLLTRSSAKEKSIIRLQNHEIPLLIQNTETGQGLSEHSKKLTKNLRLRDTAIVSLFLGTGIRISELVGIDMSDLNLNEKKVYVFRKGGHENYVFFTDSVAQRLKDYIENERVEPKDTSSAPLFTTAAGKRLGVRSVQMLVKKYAVPVAGEKITPHKLRATYATELYIQTENPMIVRDALGHHGFGSIDKYADVKEKNRQTAARNVDWV